jgi:hypothetical protein
MNSTQITGTQPHTLASACRRRTELQALGVRPETLAWAVAEASEPAIALSGLPGPEMVRACLEQACDPEKSGTESEALLVFSAAGVGQVRRELRSLGVGVPLNRNEVFGEVRRASRTSSSDQRKVFAAIRVAGAARIMRILLDRATTFTDALVDEVVRASRDGEEERVAALVQVGAVGAKALHRGIKVDATNEIMAVGVTASAGIIAGRSPRRVLRREAQAAEGSAADMLAALSFVQTASLKRAGRIATLRSRKLALLEMTRARRARQIGDAAIRRALSVADAVWLMELVDGRGGSFEQCLAGAIVEAFDSRDPERARALIDIGAFGVCRLRRGIGADVSGELRGLGSEEIEEIAEGGLAQRALRERARSAEGPRAVLLAVLSFIEPRRLKRSAANALSVCVAPMSGTVKQPVRPQPGSMVGRCAAHD